MAQERVRRQYQCAFPFGWNLPGTFARLAVHLGFIIAWINAGLPRPALIVATSAGAIMSACCVSFDRAVVRRVVRTIRYLHRGQIYNLSPGMYRTGGYLLAAGAVIVMALLALGSFGLAWAVPQVLLAGLYAFARFQGTILNLKGFSATLHLRWPVLTLKTKSFSLPLKQPALVALVVLVLTAGYRVSWVPIATCIVALWAANWLAHRALHVFFKQVGALFDNTPLRNLLLGQEVSQNAFRANTELLILATDVATPECVVYSNHEARNCDPSNQEHREQFIDGVLNSAALPARFPARAVRGRKALDGEIWTDFGIHQFLDKGSGTPRVKKVLRLDYWAPLPPEDEPVSIIDHMLVPFDRMRDRCTIKKLHEWSFEREHNPDLPEVIHIRASAQLMAMSPNIAVHNFKPGDLWRAMKFGRRILHENLAMIRRELGLDEAA